MPKNVLVIFCSFVSRAMAGSAYIPLELAAAVQDARPKCPYWSSGPRGCRKGTKCPLKHSHEIESGVHLAHVTRLVGEDGLSSIVLRPPLTAALVKYFKDLKVDVPLMQGEQWQLKSEAGRETSVITFRLVHMVEPDLAVIGKTKLQNGVYIGSAWCGRTGKEAPFLVHGTSCKLALSALADGYLRASPGVGKCGDGIYGFSVPDDSRASLTWGWNRTLGGGYNAGAMFCMGTQSIPVVKTKSGTTFPAGCLSNLGDQFAAGPCTVVYHSATFSMDCIVGELSDNLLASGYGVELHKALRSVQYYLQGQRAASSAGAAQSAAKAPAESVRILNQAVMPPKVSSLLASRLPVPPPPPPPRQHKQQEPMQNPQQLTQSLGHHTDPTLEELLDTPTVMDLKKPKVVSAASDNGCGGDEPQMRQSDVLWARTAGWGPAAPSSSSSSGVAQPPPAPPTDMFLVD